MGVTFVKLLPALDGRYGRTSSRTLAGSRKLPRPGSRKSSLDSAAEGWKRRSEPNARPLRAMPDRYTAVLNRG